MNCHFIGIYNGSQLLVRYPDDPSIDQIFLNILQRSPPTDPISFIRNESYTSCIQHEPSGLNIVVEVQNMGPQQEQLVKSSIKSIRDSFVRNHAADWKNPPPEGFSNFIPQLTKEFRRLEDSRLQKLNQISSNMNETIEQSKENLNQAYLRGSSMNEMRGATDEVSKEAQIYQRTAAETRRKIWWNKFGIWVLGGSGAFVLVFLIVLFACGGFKFPKC